MKKFAIIGAAALFAVFSSSYPQLFGNVAHAQNVAAKQSAKIMQLYRAVEVARLLQPSPHPAATLAKSTSRNGATGSQAIAGQVTTSDGTPLSRIKAIVVAFTANADSTASKGFAYVNPDGSYLLEHLLPGNFYVVAQADSYETQYHHHAATFDQAKLVQVAAFSNDTPFSFGNVVTVKDGRCCTTAC